MKQVNILQIEDSWYELLRDYFESPYFEATMKALKEELAWQPNIDVKLGNLLPHNPKYNSLATPGRQIYPYFTDILNAYNYTPFDKVKVIILSQDPYINGEAHGLAFSIKEGYKIAPSLRNIFIEIEEDLGRPTSGTTDLTRWAEQGVLLLNTILTVREGLSMSHKDLAWQILTQTTIKRLSQYSEPGLIFLLWGKHAQEYESIIDTSKHYILKAPHPSPFSARTGFFGCKHFSKINQILESQNKSIIDW
jgi:uracil-DNA glycosylase